MLNASAKSNPKANTLDAKELARLQRQDHWIVMSRWKLIMDLIFVCEYSLHPVPLILPLFYIVPHADLCNSYAAYNVFNLQKAKSQIQTFTGLSAAILR